MASKTKSSWRWLLCLAVIFIGVFVSTRCLISNDIVAGNSMQPTLESGQRLISLKQKKPRRFDIIVLNAPDAPGALYIKRVIGVAGDRITVKADQLYLNGQKQTEPYLNTAFAKRELRAFAQADKAQTFTPDFSLATLKATHQTTVPAGHYFVMGDNRLVSHDGRAFGFITAKQVQSVVIWRYWPLDRLKTF
ncbi:signal peptidase I [Lacticaseibacillus baoqingensis]|uniref:Signal peptidase I n=1 Tax=Lacticaseibacillus baoqingensis TaxID=2486013 RepID=A0ABW4E5D5_9LACO|nr:signal peptidase I [Lacticaseibacillus baoqingensis]